MSSVRSAVLAVALAAIALGGCSSETSAPLETAPLATAPPATAPVPANLGLTNTLTGTLTGTLHFLTCSLLPQQASARIGPQGGTLVLGRDVLTVPAGALSSTVEITAKSSTLGVAALEFQPEGLRFAVPARLSMDYGRCLTLGTVAKKVVYVNDAWKVLEVLPTRDDPRATQVDAPISHFSKYAIAY